MKCAVCYKFELELLSDEEICMDCLTTIDILSESYNLVVKYDQNYITIETQGDCELTQDEINVYIDNFNKLRADNIILSDSDSE